MFFAKLPHALPGGSAKPMVLTEKVHGAHMVVRVTDTDLDYFKRKATVPLDKAGAASFYDIETRGVRERYDIRFRQLWDLLQRRGLRAVLVYGELCGGYMPNVGGGTPTRAVQTGVWYAPELEYVVFDLALETDDGAVATLPWPTLQTVARRCNLVVVPEISRVTANGALPAGLDINSIQTRVPQLFGFEPVPGADLVEGVVARPLNGGGAPGVGGGKLKAVAFAEARFHAAVGQTPCGPLGAYVTVNRLRNVASHFGSLADNGDVDVWVQRLLDDAAEEAMADGVFDDGRYSGALRTRAIEVVTSAMAA